MPEASTPAQTSARGDAMLLELLQLLQAEGRVEVYWRDRSHTFPKTRYGFELTPEDTLRISVST